MPLWYEVTLLTRTLTMPCVFSLSLFPLLAFLKHNLVTKLLASLQATAPYFQTP